MKLVRFRMPGWPTDVDKIGLDTDRGVADLAAAVRMRLAGRPGNPGTIADVISHDLKRFIELGDFATDLARDVASWIQAGNGAEAVYDGGQVQRLAPITNPGKLVAVGLNYHLHADETNMKVPEHPVFFTKYSSSIIGPGDPIVRPAMTTKLDYEVELAVVIGRQVRNVPVDDAMSAVFGYTILNDVTARDLQLELGGQWVAGKAVDTFSPLGPAVVVADEFGDPQAARLRLWVNGELRQDASTADMLWPVPDLISYLSSLFTLYPGDIIATGTPAGIGMALNPPKYLQAGDVVRAEVSGIGRLENYVTE